MPSISGAPPFGNDLYRLQVELFNDGPEMEVELERRANRIDFKVELEDVAVGSYTLTVGGTQRGSLQVVSVPGGTEGAARVHLARATVRRAERAATALAAAEPVNPAALAYLNRLSDYLFVLARAVNAGGAGDVLWVPGQHR